MSASDKQSTPTPVKHWGDAPGTNWSDLRGVLGAIEVTGSPQPTQPEPLKEQK